MGLRRNGGSGARKTVVDTGKTTASPVTTDVVRRLQRAGSWESARIAREYSKGSKK
jgi:hypothetical protein